MDCIFCKIINKEIETKILYEDDEVLVFPDLHPVKPIHLLIIPKEHIEDFVQVENLFLISKLFSVAQKMIKREGLKDRGYRLVINGGGAQLVPHLHLHLIGPLSNTAQL